VIRFYLPKNDTSLGIKNGTLGRIVELNKNKIKAVVKENGVERTVSFAPQLYARFDNGWAVTIHKNQGVTVDRSFVLGSFEQYRNLSYVAMTRHIKRVYLFVSDLDFWREEKIYDRLGRAQEKLSSLDYLDSKDAAALLQKEDKILSRAFEKIGSRLDAIGYVGHRRWRDLCSRFLGTSFESQNIRIDRDVLEGLTSESDRASNLLYKRDKQDTRQDVSSVGRVGDISSSKRSANRRLSKHEFQRFMDTIQQNVNYESLIPSLLGQEMNSKMSTPSQHRYGNNGSLSINVKTGRWKNFETGLGGGILKLIEQERGVDFKGALSIISPYCRGDVSRQIDDYLSGTSRVSAKRLSSDEIKVLEQKSEAHKQEQEARQQVEREEKIKSVRDLFDKTVSVTNTLAHQYLAEVRGIKGELSDDLRFIPAKTKFSYGGKDRFVRDGALASIARDNQGDIQAIQITYLSADGNRATINNEEKLPKITYGIAQGSFVEVQKGRGDGLCSAGSINLEYLSSTP